MTIEVISREEIGLIPAVRKTPFVPAEVDRNVAHYFGVDSKYLTIKDLYAIHRGTQWHDITSKGYSDIMYSGGANPFDPRPMVLRGLDNMGAANGDRVKNGLGPSFLFPWGPDMIWVTRIPNWEDNILSSAQAWDALVQEHFGKDMGWSDHQGIGRATACAGDWIRARFEQLDFRPAPPLPVWRPPYAFTERALIGLKKRSSRAIQWMGFQDYSEVNYLQDFLNMTSPLGCPVTGVWDAISDDRLFKFQGYMAQHGFPCRPNGLSDADTWATVVLVCAQQGILEGTPGFWS